MPKHFIILTEDDMDKLSAGWPVNLNDGEDGSTVSIFTEEGYKKHQQFWGEVEDDT